MDTEQYKMLEEQAKGVLKEMGIPFLPNADIPEGYFSARISVGRGESEDDLEGTLADFRVYLKECGLDIVSSIQVGYMAGNSRRPLISAFGYVFCGEPNPSCSSCLI